MQHVENDKECLLGATHALMLEVILTLGLASSLQQFSQAFSDGFGSEHGVFLHVVVDHHWRHLELLKQFEQVANQAIFLAHNFPLLLLNIRRVFDQCLLIHNLVSSEKLLLVHLS